MSVKDETQLQLRIQKLITSRGGYVNKNHGSMITRKGIPDLTICYKGVPMYWEIKTPDTAKDVSAAQGIQLRLANRAGAFTAVVASYEEAKRLLDLCDEYTKETGGVNHSYPEFERFLIRHNERWDDGQDY